MHSEWMKVMLAEIERKQAQEREGREERQRRAAERQSTTTPGAVDSTKRSRKRR
jgi:hypothetical protein